MEWDLSLSSAAESHSLDKASVYTMTSPIHRGSTIALLALSPGADPEKKCFQPGELHTQFLNNGIVTTQGQIQDFGC